jgi:hypothetical protein
MEKEMTEEAMGAFNASLHRNNSKIRSDRANAISEDTQLIYRRKIEDIELNLTRLRRSQENILDLSPTDAQSLVLANDFDSNAFAETDMGIGIEIRNEEIRLEVSKARYGFLFLGGV